MKRCASCGDVFQTGDVRYHGSLYTAPIETLLCVSCRNYEEDAGTNDVPELLALYRK
jgi:hypothetical protein